MTWRLLAKALGEKASECDRESDRVAAIRLLGQVVIAQMTDFLNNEGQWCLLCLLESLGPSLPLVSDQ